MHFIANQNLILCVGPVSECNETSLSGFQLLKKMLGESAFFQQGHPSCFITDNSEAERNALRTVWTHSQRFLCVFHILQAWRWLCDGSHAVRKEDPPTLMDIAKILVFAGSEASFQDDWHAFGQTPEAQKYDNFMRYVLIKIFSNCYVYFHRTIVLDMNI